MNMTVNIGKFGEVLTPVYLVEEMLDQLPSDVWLCKDKKWLDPCAGRNAVFPIQVYKRLMKSLENEIKCPIQRDSHIWDNMIYMVEIQEDAVEELKLNIKKARHEYLQQ